MAERTADIAVVEGAGVHRIGIVALQSRLRDQGQVLERNPAA